jgi:hypothetical protein
MGGDYKKQFSYFLLYAARLKEYEAEVRERLIG